MSERKESAVAWKAAKLEHKDALGRVLCAGENLVSEMYAGDPDTVESLRIVLEDACESARVAEGKVNGAFARFRSTMTTPRKERR